MRACVRTCVCVSTSVQVRERLCMLVHLLSFKSLLLCCFYKLVKCAQLEPCDSIVKLSQSIGLEEKNQLLMSLFKNRFCNLFRVIIITISVIIPLIIVIVPVIILHISYKVSRLNSFLML